MKKFIFSMVAMLMMATTINAQSQSNYTGSAKFTDNVAVTLQGGVVTPFNDFFKNGSTTPVIVLGAEKYINPWLGVAVEGRTTVGTGDKYNPHTAFDVINVSGYVKFNVLNILKFDGTRRFFEPVIYTGLGWGHTNCSAVPNMYATSGQVGLVPGAHVTVLQRDYMTYRAGAELNFNIGKDKAFAVVVNPSVVWGDICNGYLVKQNANFEITAGLVYHFKTSNGTRTFAKAKLYDQAEVDALKARIAELQANPVVQIKETRVEVPVKQPNNTFAVTFAQNSAELTDAAKATLNKVSTQKTVTVVGSTSPEGTVARNTALAQERADAVAEYLKSRGVTVTSATGGDAGRIAVITIQ